jgi:hypothetical protein
LLRPLPHQGVYARLRGLWRERAQDSGHKRIGVRGPLRQKRFSKRPPSPNRICGGSEQPSPNIAREDGRKRPDGGEGTNTSAAFGDAVGLAAAAIGRHLKPFRRFSAVIYCTALDHCAGCRYRIDRDRQLRAECNPQIHCGKISPAGGDADAEGWGLGRRLGVAAGRMPIWHRGRPVVCACHRRMRWAAGVVGAAPSGRWAWRRRHL